jgi:hypothetical protein
VFARDISTESIFAGEYLIAQRFAVYRDQPEARDERIRLARALLRTGKTESAAEIYDALRSEGAMDLSEEEFVEQIEFPRAVAYLRLGEQQNCVDHNAPDSCLFPIVPRATHALPCGSEVAVDALLEILERQPDDATVRWLLNIAYMTLGQYPDGVPEKWRIDPASYRSSSELRPFKNVAGELGVAINGVSGGAVLEDFDGDGALDILVSCNYPIDGPGGQLRLFKNDGNGAFGEVTESAGLTGILGGLNMVQADYNNDGHPDVFLLRGAWRFDHGQWPNTLLRNNGDGTFTDVSVEAGVLSFSPTQTAAWGDFDNDGWIDLFVGNETGMPARGHGIVDGAILTVIKGAINLVNSDPPGHLYHNNGDGTFTDVLSDVAIDPFGWVKGVAWGDYNGDGRLDLYLSLYAESNYLYRNDGPDGSGGWIFTDVTADALVGDPIDSFATWFWDYDNDGMTDLFVAGYVYPEVEFAHDGLPIELEFSSHAEIEDFLGGEGGLESGKPRLYRNNGDGTFSDTSQNVGIDRSVSAMGANFGDVDNDGFLDIYLGTGVPQLDYLVPNRLFHNKEAIEFQDASVAANVAHLQKGHGIAFGDIDGDGDQDIYVTMGGAFPGDVFPNALFENPGYGNNWITLKLEGTQANRSAIGARIELTVAIATSETTGRTFYRTVGSGGSFGASSLQQEIGIGSADRIRHLRITWPDCHGSVEEYGELEPNTVYSIRQGEQPVRREAGRIARSKAG